MAPASHTALSQPGWAGRRPNSARRNRGQQLCRLAAGSILPPGPSLCSTRRQPHHATQTHTGHAPWGMQSTRTPTTRPAPGAHSKGLAWGIGRAASAGRVSVGPGSGQHQELWQGLSSNRQACRGAGAWQDGDTHGLGVEGGRHHLHPHADGLLGTWLGWCGRVVGGCPSMCVRHQQACCTSTPGRLGPL